VIKYYKPFQKNLKDKTMIDLRISKYYLIEHGVRTTPKRIFSQPIQDE